MACVGEDFDFGEGFDGFCVGGGDDVVIFAVDGEERNACCFEGVCEIFRLFAAFEDGVSEGLERAWNTIEPLVFQDIVNHMAADKG